MCVGGWYSLNCAKSSRFTTAATVAARELPSRLKQAFCWLEVVIDLCPTGCDIPTAVLAYTTQSIMQYICQTLHSQAFFEQVPAVHGTIVTASTWQMLHQAHIGSLLCSPALSLRLPLAVLSDSTGSSASSPAVAACLPFPVGSLPSKPEPEPSRQLRCASSRSRCA